MRFALLADIHANLEALKACLAHAEAQNPDRWAFIGDIVGYGADPEAVTDIVMAHAQAGAIVVQGNHDAAAAGMGGEDMNETAFAAIRWTQDRLSTGHRAFLSLLPFSERADGILFVHASAVAPERWIYVTDTLSAAQSMNAGRATYVISGHVHVPQLYVQDPAGRPRALEVQAGIPVPVARDRRWLAVIPSCGQPRDGNPEAGYALLDTGRAELTYIRLPYDYAAAARKIRKAGLPERLAARLAHGT
jgi:diadenosine tetraphosphatase ApaH/serine/threonine PP2A family protein phosphatase